MFKNIRSMYGNWQNLKLNFSTWELKMYFADVAVERYGDDWLTNEKLKTWNLLFSKNQWGTRIQKMSERP
jgi:hypothetical protein